jgi:hypothetical protein
VPLANEIGTVTLPSPTFIARTVPCSGFPGFLDDSLKTYGGHDVNDLLINSKPHQP